MKKLLPVIILIFIVLAVKVWAGDDANYTVLGFSQDGTYLAFEQYGVHDGSGYPYAEIYIIDTINNSWIERPYKYCKEESEAEATLTRKKVQKIAAAALRKYKIDSKNQGTSLAKKEIAHVTKKPYGSPSYEHMMRTGYITSIDDSLKCFISSIPFEAKDDKGKLKKYELILEEIPCENLDFEIVPLRKISLKLKNKNSGKIKILQADKRLPKSRGEAFGYKIQEVIIFKQIIAVFIRISSVGYEGSNARYMVITGRL